MDQNQIIFCVITLAALVLFVTEKLRVDLIGMLIILALALTGLLDVKQAFSGFASEPGIILCAVFVLSAGLSRTGATDVIGHWVGRIAGGTETRAILTIMTAVALMSAFTHHVMVTAMMLPIVMKLCKEKGLAPSRLLIPMATAASLGTVLTIIGAPAFLLANSVIKRSGAEPLGVFTVAKVGLPIVGASFIFIILTRWLLPKKTGSNNLDDRFKLSEILTELVIPDNSRWVEFTMPDFQEKNVDRFKVHSWKRDGQEFNLNEDSIVLKEGDVLSVTLDVDELVSIEERYGLAVRAVRRYSYEVTDEKNTSLADQSGRIFQALIAPKSNFIGKTISDLRFFHRYGAATVGLWRKDGWVTDSISDIKLQAGDLVVLWGSEDRLEELSQHKGFLMFMPLYGKAKFRFRMNLALSIMFGSMILAATGVMEPYVAFVLGAVIMILSKCISVEDAYESIEAKIYIMIAGVIPLGLAMEKTGVDKFLAEHIIHWTQGWNTFSMLLIFFWFSALLTQILSDAATTILIAPIAVVIANKLGIPVTAAVVTVTVGAVASFLTPIGHHGNLLILSPGGYRFSDFLKVGLPLTVIISLVTCWMSLQVWT